MCLGLPLMPKENNWHHLICHWFFLRAHSFVLLWARLDWPQNCGTITLNGFEILFHHQSSDLADYSSQLPSIGELVRVLCRRHSEVEGVDVSAVFPLMAFRASDMQPSATLFRDPAKLYQNNMQIFIVYNMKQYAIVYCIKSNLVTLSYVGKLDNINLHV